MSCQNPTSQSSDGGGDRLEAGAGRRPFDHSATAWLVGQGVRYLNAADKEGELAYRRVVELLLRCEDLVGTVAGLMRASPSGDTPLRWCLLYLLGDAGGAAAAEFLVNAALEKLPDKHPDDGCESLADTETLVRTMAVHALGSIAGRHPEAAEHIMTIVSKRPERAILIEAVKVGRELGLADKIRDLLPKEDHWILDIRRARTEELFAEAEREDGKERGFTPPKTGSLRTSPQSACCIRKEG
jgi:hypothetical protein